MKIISLQKKTLILLVSIFTISTILVSLDLRAAWAEDKCWKCNGAPGVGHCRPIPCPAEPDAGTLMSDKTAGSLSLNDTVSSNSNVSG